MTSHDHNATMDALKRALPYIRLYKGRTFVVKIGGSVCANEEGLRGAALANLLPFLCADATGSRQVNLGRGQAQQLGTQGPPDIGRRYFTVRRRCGDHRGPRGFDTFGGWGRNAFRATCVCSAVHGGSRCLHLGMCQSLGRRDAGQVLQIRKNNSCSGSNGLPVSCVRPIGVVLADGRLELRLPQAISGIDELREAVQRIAFAGNDRHARIREPFRVG